MKALISYLKTIGLIFFFALALYMINPYNYGYVFGYVMVPLVLIKKDFISKNLDFDVFLLSLFSITYALFYSFQAEQSQGLQYIAIYAFFPPVFYFAGKYMTGNLIDNKAIFYLLFTITFLFSLTAMISVFINFLEGGFSQVERNLPNFWTGKNVSATGMAAAFTFNMCIPALLIAYHDKMGKLFTIIGVPVFVISLICVLRLGSRTQLGIFLITCIAALIYIVPKQSPKRNFALILVLAGIISYILTKVSFDLNADWLTTFAGRMDDSGNSISSGGGRTERWLKSIEYLFSHPLGWSVRDFGFSHNLWLDAARVAGVIPFILLVIFSIGAYTKLFKTIRIGQRPISLNLIFLIYGLAFFIILNVEPILDGIFPLFIMFCLYTGILNKYYEISRQ